MSHLNSHCKQDMINFIDPTVGESSPRKKIKNKYIYIYIERELKKRVIFKQNIHTPDIIF